METWRGLNYYTRNPGEWVHLMNLSTAEWRIGSFPANVYAIPGALNDTIKGLLNESINGNLSDTDFLIPHASKTTDGTGKIESIVFGSTSGIVFAWAIVWLVYNVYFSRYDETAEAHRRIAGRGEPDIELAMMDDRRPTGRRDHVDWPRFVKRLQEYFYHGDSSEPEVKSKDYSAEGIEAEDIEDVAALLRKMYRIESLLHSKEDSREISRDREIRDYRKQRTAIISQVNARLQEWNKHLNSPEQGEAMDEERRKEREEQRKKVNDIQKIMDRIQSRRRSS